MNLALIQTQRTCIFMELSDNMKNKTLIELHELIGGTDKHTTHAFSYFYGPFLSPKRETAKKVLELGVSWLGSGDLEALGHYFPNAELHGVDIEPLVRVAKEHQAPNITFHQMDGYDPAQLDSAFGDTKWDLVLDDGPHTKESQLFCLNYFHSKLASRGVILVEDVPPESIDFIVEGFEGDPRYISVVDRTRTPRIPYHNDGRPCWNEYILVYMPEVAD